MENLDDRVILITGGAQGLGKAISTTLAEAGATVIIGDIQEEKAKAVAEELSKNGKVEFIKLDLSSETNVEEVINEVKSKYGKLDALINNAGIDFTKPITELKVSEWDAAMNVNLRGPFLTSKFA